MLSDGGRYSPSLRGYIATGRRTWERIPVAAILAEFENPTAKRHHKASLALDFSEEALHPLV
jgi:hypothetical protein